MYGHIAITRGNMATDHQDHQVTIFFLKRHFPLSSLESQSANAAHLVCLCAGPLAPGTVGVSLCTFLLIMGTGHKWVPCFCSGPVGENGLADLGRLKRNGLKDL